jgi:hypothetical protein
VGYCEAVFGHSGSKTVGTAVRKDVNSEIMLCYIVKKTRPEAS